MANLYDTVLQEIRDRCPDINWKLGGLLRELLVEPVAAMERAVSGYINSILASVDIEAALADPANNVDTLNVWMDRLHIATPEQRDAEGEVTIVTASNDPLLVPQYAIFLCGEQQLRTTRARNFTAVDFTLSPSGVYSVTVPVQTYSSASPNIKENTPVTWDSAPDSVIDAYVSSAVTGGINTATPQAKATLISAALTAPGMAGEESISAALVRAFPDAVINAVASKPYGALKPADVSLFVKAKALPIRVEEQVIIQRDSDDAYYAIIPETGVAQILEARTTDSRYLDFDVDWDSIRGQLKIKFHENQNIEDTQQITIAYTKFSILSSVSDWLNSEQRALPYGFVCKTPAVAQVSLILNLGGSDLDITTKTAIQDYICDKPLNAPISDAEISAILKSAGYSLNSSILYSVKIQHKNYTDVCSSAGIFSPAGHVGILGAPVAAYATVNDIESY